MVIKRKDFQKAAAFIHEFLLKLSEDVECAEVRDTLNLALLHMQKYYRLIQNRSQEKNGHTLSLTARGMSPMTPFVDAPDKFIWRWVHLDNTRNLAMSLADSLSVVVLPQLISATKNGDVELMKELLQQDPICRECTDGLGRTAVMYAVHFFRHDALEFLLEHKADINAQAHDESTAIHRACHDANHVALKLLVDFGGDITICDVQGRAPIHWAVTTQSTECLKILLASGVMVDTRDKDMLTPSMWACRMDNIQHFELLCHANNTVEEFDGIERDANGRTWMHWSVRRTQPLECLQTLLTPDSAAIKDKEGKTVLLVAAEMGSLHACRVIFEIAGERCIKDQDNQGRTALHVATMGGHGDVVNFLLDKNADVNVVDNYNATAWDYARIRKLHYCQLIIMSHQRQRMSSNPTSPMPHGLGLLMQTDPGMSSDFSKMGARIRSNQSTPITPPHPPKRPRSSRILVRRANSLTNADRERLLNSGIDRANSSEERLFMNQTGPHTERTMVNLNTFNKRLSAEDVFYNGREDTIMTDSSRPVFEDENDEISVGGMDVSDIENEEDNLHHHLTQSSRSNYQKNSRPRPKPRKRPEYLRSPSPPIHIQNRGDHNVRNIVSVNNMNNNSNNNPQQVQQRLQHQHLTHHNKPDDVALESTTCTLDQKGKPGFQQVRPQARVPPTPVYRPPRGAPIPSPPSATPQKPHMIRQQHPLPSSTYRGPQQHHAPTSASHGPPSAQQQSRDLLSPQSRDASPSLSSQSSELQQHSSRSQGERPNSGGKQPPGVLEGFRIPPPALSPLQNAPKPPDLDKIDRKDKKKRKKEKREGKLQTQKPDHPSDIEPPVGFAAPLHPHIRVQSGIGSHFNPSSIPPPKYGQSEPQISESRYVDENIENDSKPPIVNGFAVQIQEGVAKSAKPRYKTGMIVVEDAEKENKSREMEDDKGEGNNTMSTTSLNDDNEGPFIPPPPSFRGVTRSGAVGRPLAQSIPQDNKSSRMVLTSAKPPLPKNRNSLSSSNPRSSTKRTS